MHKQSTCLYTPVICRVLIFFARKQNAQGAQNAAHHSVGIHENTLGVMREGPAVEFGEGHAQVGSLHHGQVCCVATVQHIHHPHLIVDPLERRPNDLQYYEMNRRQQSRWKSRAHRNGNRYDSEMWRR